MKRLGRRGRALGQIGSDEDLLDDETKKQLFAGAGITSDVLEDMSVEEKQGTLKAILASNPSLLPQLTTERSPAAVPVTRTRHDSSTPCKQPDTDNKAETVATQGAVAHIVHADSSDSISTHSSDSSLSCGGSDFSVVPQPARQLEVKSPDGLDLLPSPSGLGDLVQTEQIMDRQMDEELPSPTPLEKPVELVLDSDEEKVEEEEETQPYDLDCLVADSKASAQITKHKIMMEETIPETQTTDSNSETHSQDEPMEIPRLCASIVKPAESSRTRDSTSAASAHFGLHPAVEVEQDVPLTRIYRAHRSPEQTFWPSFYVPCTVKDPDVYSDVIKQVFDIYMRRVCRAQKQINHVSRGWGKPVSAGCHVKGCLRARTSRLQVEQAQDGEGKRGRAVRRKYPQGSGVMNQPRKYDDDESDDFDLKFPQTLKEDADSHQRLQSERRKRKVHDQTRSAKGCQPPLCHVIDEQNEDVVDSEEDDKGSGEWIPVKVTRSSVKRQPEVTSGNKKRTQSRENNKKRQDDDRAESGNVKVSKNVAGTSRKVKQVNTLRKDDHDTVSVDRCEFDAMLTGNRSSVRHKYAWSDDEDEIVISRMGPGHASTGGKHTPLSNMSNLGSRQTPDADVKVGRVGSLDGQVDQQNTDLVAEAELRKHKSGGDRSLAWLMIDLSNSNEGPDSSQHAEETTTTHLGAVTVGVSGSQSSESLLDGQGDLYSTQLSRSAHHPSTDSLLPSTSSLQRSRRQGQTTSRVTNISSCPTADTLSVDSHVEVKLPHERPFRIALKSQKHEKLAVGEASTHGTSGVVSGLSFKQNNTGNCDRSNDETDDRANVKGGITEVNDDDVMKERKGDSNCDLKQDSRLLRPNRCLKRNPVVIIQPLAEKRRKLHYSADQKKMKSDAISDTCAVMPAAASVASSPGSVGRPLPPDPGHTEQLQDDESTCPICGQYFHPSKLEAHASSCGEDAEVTIEGHSDDEIRCIRCALQISKENIKEHQTHCLHMDGHARRVTRSNRE